MLEKFSWKFQYEYPLNHLYIIFRLLGISAYKKNKNRFKVCHLTRLLSIPVLLLMATCHYFVVAVLFQVYKGYLNIPIGIAFLSYGIGCIASYVNLVIKNNKICELMNEITEMKKILEAKNPDYKFGTSISAFTFFWLGFSFIVAFNVHDSLVETSKYKFNQFWIQMAVDFILVMIFIMDAHFVAVAVTVRDLFKCFRHIFKVNTLKKDFDVRDFETRQVTKAINLLRFCKHNHKVLHGMREQVNKNFGIVNFSSVTYTLILLIYVAYSNVKRYKHDPYESVKEAAFYIIHYGGKLLALLRFCAKVNEEVSLAWK